MARMARMARNAGEAVKAGFYWRPAQWQLLTVAEDGETLPGAGEVYYPVPSLLMLAVAPVMGALFVMFLPFIGVAIVVEHAFHAAVRMLHKTAAGSSPEPKQQQR